MTVYLTWLLVPDRLGMSISETGDLQGFSCTTITRVYGEWAEIEKLSSERRFSEGKCLVDGRGQK